MGSGVIVVALQSLRIGRLQILTARGLDLDQTVAVGALITSTIGLEAGGVDGSFSVGHGD